MFKSHKLQMLIGGLIVGIMAVVLVILGNPGNMGLCIACFIRDITGNLGLHNGKIVQAMRPEIIGLLIGSTLWAIKKKEFQSVGGSSPLVRFILGTLVMIGALVFLGCPLRMVLRMAAGDLNAVVGLLGFIVGISLGVVFLQKGFSLGRTHPQKKAEGLALTFVATVIFIVFLIVPGIFFNSVEGPGSMHAPWMIALAFGLILGALSYQTRLCMVGGIRDIILFRDFHLMSGFLAIFFGGLLVNLFNNTFSLSFAGQPIASPDQIWNFLGMVLVGLASSLLGGCPLRQCVLAGGGNVDSAITVLGLIFGAILSHNLGLASSGSGSTLNGQIAVLIGLAIIIAIAFIYRRKEA